MTIATVTGARDLSRFEELPVELIDDLPNAADDAASSSRSGFGDSFDRVQAGIQGWLRHWEPQRLPAFTPVRRWCISIRRPGGPGRRGCAASTRRCPIRSRCSGHARCRRNFMRATAP